MKDLESQHLYELTWGLPILYKGVRLYPIKVSDIFLFQSVIHSLLIDPLDYPNEKYQSMSRLKFLISISENANATNLSDREKPFRYLSYCFIKLLQIVFQTEDISVSDPKNPTRNGKILRIISHDEDGDHELIVSHKEFEILRELILYQNGVDFSDEDVPVEMRLRYETDQSRSRTKLLISTEQYIDLVCVQMGIQRSQIRNMPLREFYMHRSQLISKDVYLAQIQGSMSGFVSFKKEPRHWLCPENKKEVIMSHFKTTEEIKGLMNN